jgi:hypothetical protein
MKTMAVFYEDPIWTMFCTFSHMQFELTKLLKRNKWLKMVSTTFSGIIETVLHVTKLKDLIIVPKGVTIENTWTGYSSTSSIAVATNISSALNKYVIAVVISGGGSPSSVTLNGAAMTSLISVGSCGIYGIIPGSTGAQNFVANAGAGLTWRVAVFELSGVNQSTPTLDAKNTYQNTATITTPSMVCSPYGLVIDGILFASGTVSENSAQTVTTINAIKTAGVTRPTGTTITTSWTTTSSSQGSLSAVSINPV